MQTVYLFASGDCREETNRACWPAQEELEVTLASRCEALGATVKRAHEYDAARGHGFLCSQRQCIDAFAEIDPEAPVIVAEAVWQYSRHILPGLSNHKGPILTVANWSGEWPGLVGLLKLNGSLTKGGISYSTLWSEDFSDPLFLDGLQQWLSGGEIRHDQSHVRPFSYEGADLELVELGKELADALLRHKAIMGVFGEACTNMFNAIVAESILMPLGVFKERVSESTYYQATKQVTHDEASGVFDWIVGRGLTFHLGDDHERDLTLEQVLTQCRMYVAAVRLADEFACDVIGLQVPRGSDVLLPASDLVEGMLNNSDRPPVRNSAGKIIRDGMPIPHFNEIDECAGLDALLINRVHSALGQPVETTLHDIRWGDVDPTGTQEGFVWVFEISGAAPPAHHIGGWAGSDSFRQPAKYHPNGGGTLRGIAKPGEVIWSRIYVVDDMLCMDIGRGSAVELPPQETERRWNATTPQWPIMHAVLHGVSRDQMMGRHKSNHIQLVYAESADAADRALETRAVMASELGIKVYVIGSNQS